MRSLRRRITCVAASRSLKHHQSPWIVDANGPGLLGTCCRPPTCALPFLSRFGQNERLFPLPLCLSPSAIYVLSLPRPTSLPIAPSPLSTCARYAPCLDRRSRSFSSSQLPWLARIRHAPAAINKDLFDEHPLQAFSVTGNHNNVSHHHPQPSGFRFGCSCSPQRPPPTPASPSCCSRTTRYVRRICTPGLQSVVVTTSISPPKWQPWTVRIRMGFQRRRSVGYGLSKADGRFPCVTRGGYLHLAIHENLEKQGHLYLRLDNLRVSLASASRLDWLRR